MSARMLAERWMQPQCASTSSSSSSKSRRARRVVVANAELARTRTRGDASRERRSPRGDQCFAKTVDEERGMAASLVKPSSKAKGHEERNASAKNEGTRGEDEETVETKRRERRRRRRRRKNSSGARRNEGRASLANTKSGGTKKEGNGKDATMEKDSPDGVVLLDARTEKVLGEAVKELLRLEYIAKALDNDELFTGTRGEGMDASDEKNPMATSDAILSIFDAKPKNATEMISDSRSKNRSRREEDVVYEQKFARAAELNVNELRTRLDAGKRARQILVTKNIGLARLCAYRTMKQRNTGANTNFSYQLSDMISDGQEGLVKAASKYDPSLGFRFSTYAYAWVLSSIQRGLDSNSNTIRTPTHARVEKMKIKNIEKNLEASLGRMPTDEEVARVAGVDVKRLELISNFGVSYAMQRATGNRSFADEIGDTSEILVADQGDENGATPSADFCTTDAEERALILVERDLFKDDLEQVFDTLLPRERFVLRHKFGLDEFEDELPERGNSMVNILARKMGLSVSAVRSIEQRALQKLRAPQRAAILHKHAILPEDRCKFSSNPMRVDDRPIVGGVKAAKGQNKSVEEEISNILLERVEGTIKSEEVEKIAQSSVRNTTWSSYELKLMNDMRAKGIPWKKVAAAIGRTETSCKQMYRKVGGSTRKHTPSMDEKTKAAMQKIEEDDTIING